MYTESSPTSENLKTLCIRLSMVYLYIYISKMAIPDNSAIRSLFSLVHSVLFLHLPGGARIHAGLSLMHLRLLWRRFAILALLNSNWRNTARQLA